MDVYEYILIIFLSLLVPLYFYFNKIQRQKRFLNNFPSPPAEFPFGNAREFLKSGFLNTLVKFTKEYGSMIHLRMGPTQHGLVTSDYDFLQFMLSSHKSFHKSENLRYLAPWIGKGLILSEDEQWKTHRRLITPAFHFKILEKFVETFETSSDVLIQKLSAIKENQSVDIHPYIIRCTLNVICETAMGIEVDVQNNETSSYFHSCKEMCRIFIARSTSPLKRYDFFYRFTKDYAIEKKALEILVGQTEKVINLKTEKLAEKQHASNGIETKKGKKVFLDILLEVDDNILSKDELRDEVNTFMFAGHDTTAAATSFVLYCLANHRDIQDKVLEEQDQIFDCVRNPKVTYANLQEMKYLENAIKEGMRLYSPVPLVGRRTTEEVNYNGMVIAEDINILVFLQGLHMNPKYYPNPEKFDPSRFERTEDKHPFSYIPFSAGPRNCIGQKYAMLEIKSLVSKIVRNFELSPPIPLHTMKLEAETVLKSLNGVKIGLKLR